MTDRIAPASPELRKFYSARHDWRNSGEERMRFRKHMQLARVRPGSAVLDIGSRNGDLRNYLPRDVTYQGLDIAPEFAAPDILIHDITSGLPFPDASFDYVFMVEVLEHTPTACGWSRCPIRITSRRSSGISFTCRTSRGTSTAGPDRPSRVSER
jgi:SAM-dependent methyltransferase